MNIFRGKMKTALKIVVYGQEGVGKSTFASRFPNPVFIDTEGSTKQLDVARFDPPSSWEMLMQQVDYAKQHPEQIGTLVIDTADWAEKLCIRQICSRAKKEGIEDFGWGKGYTYVGEEFGRLLNKLSDVIDVGINVVVTAHAQMRKVEQPDEMGSYDRWELKLSKQCSPLLKEWADLLLFANYKTIVVNTGDKKYKGKGGQQRIMYTTHTASWDAKNRHDLPDVLPFDYAQIAHIIENRTSVPVAPTPAPTPEPIKKKEPEPEAPDPLDSFVEDLKAADVPVEVKSTRPAADKYPEYVPEALADLMREKQLTVSDIERVVEARGYFPPGTPFENYPSDFVEGCLIAAFPQLYAFAMENNLIDLPF